jgi:ELWxxDGT repeat protein
MNRTASALLVIAVLALASPAAAQAAYLVKDIARGSDSRGGSYPDSMWSFQGKVFFAAEEPSSGRELWITDGNGSGTRLLADFCSGTCSSSPLPLGTARSLLFGIAFPNLSSGSEPHSGSLWRSDGTREGTFLLPDPLNPVSLPFTPQGVEPVDTPQAPAVFGPDVAYFAGCNEKCGVWRTDGTAAGTIELKELPETSFFGPRELTLVGGRLFFASVNQLWTSDGTPEGTTLIKEFRFTPPHLFTALGSKVLFLAPAAAPATGEELWVTDGTAAGTQALTSFEAEKPFQQTHFLKTLGDKAYFVADDVTHGAELWASNGTAAGTARITDFGFNNPFGWEESFPQDAGLFSWELEKLGNRLVFWATDGLTDYKPWSILGTPESTAPICSDCGSGSSEGRFLVLNGKLIFRGGRDFSENSVWATDGTATGTKLLALSCYGCGSALALVSGAVFFDGPKTGTGELSSTLWTSDGTPQGTRMFAAVELSSFRPSLGVAPLGSKVLFGGSVDGEHSDRELWSSDGTPDGTRLVADINRSGNGANVTTIVAAGERVFFTASEDGRDYDRNVWRSGGTEQSTQKSPAPAISDLGEKSQLVTAGGKVFLVRPSYPFGDQLWRVQDDGQMQQLTDWGDNHKATSPVDFHGQLYFLRDKRELWTSDGSVPGTRKVIDVPGAKSLDFLQAPGAEMWFLAEGPSGFGLSQVWRTDGTQAGTHLVHDFGSYRTLRDPEFTQIGSTVYFVALRSAGDDFDYQVWKTDGTDAGTVRISDFPGLNAVRGMPAELTAFQGNLYFFASLPDGPQALWRSDGTSGSTGMVRQFPKQPSMAFSIFDIPHLGLTALGSRLVFAVNDSVHGREPWISDGTPGGTALLRDIFPGPSGSGVTSFTAAAGQLYFAADDGGHGFEPWHTDGTPDGTRLVQDLAPEGASSYPANFTIAGNLLFFSADDGITGNELWALPLSGPACQAGPTALCLNNGRFRVEAHWKVPNGGEEAGHAVPLSTDTGYFWFFDPANVEAILKVLDATTFNGHFWVFYGALSNVEYSLTVTDTQTGLARRYFNPQGQFASVGDTNGFGPLGAYDRKSLAAPAAPLLVSERTDPAAATGTCVPGASRLCLSNGRFAVEAAWKDFAGRTGTGTAVGLTGDTGYFWFFDPANVEAVLKVLDATTFNGHFWVFYGALSNVEYTLTVTDTVTGHVKIYRNPLGRFASAGDIIAF